MKAFFTSKTVYTAIISMIVLVIIMFLIGGKNVSVEGLPDYPPVVTMGLLILVVIASCLLMISVVILSKRLLGITYWFYFLCIGAVIVISNKIGLNFMATTSDVALFGWDYFFKFLITNDLYAQWFVKTSGEDIVQLTILGIILRLLLCFIYGYTCDLISIKRYQRSLQKTKYDYYVNNQLVGENQPFDELNRYYVYLTTLDNEIGISVHEREIYFDLINIESFDVEYTDEKELRLTNFKKYEPTDT